MSATFEIKFNPNPLQKGFITSTARADLFSSRRGEGKSTALAWAAYFHTRHNPSAKWAIIRDTWENLQQTTQRTFFDWFPPGLMGEWHAGKKTFTWASGVAEGEVQFFGMDSPDDASRLLSRELAGFGMDEPAPAMGQTGIDEMIFDVALSSLRQPDMKWYAAKLAENNPDESHWTYRRFVQPGTPGFELWQPLSPENKANLPPTYYEDLRRMWAHRPDLIRRFVEGEFGFQQVGKAVTPQWSDKLHLAVGLYPIKNLDLYLLWDFGLNPTCIITQKTPMGSWHILDAFVGEGIGTSELINDVVKPVLVDRYGMARSRSRQLHHIGDPAGETREQSDARRSAVLMIRRELPGTWKAGPVKPHMRLEPLRTALTRSIGGKGLIQVDRDRAAAVWYALRGGWHYHIARTGLTSTTPKKDIHSHPGDAMSYGAAVMFPTASFTRKKSGLLVPQEAGFFGKGSFKFGPQPSYLPQHGSELRGYGE